MRCFISKLFSYYRAIKLKLNCIFDPFIKFEIGKSTSLKLASFSNAKQIKAIFHERQHCLLYL